MATETAMAERIVPKRFPALDGLRGAAVIAVFCFHYGSGASSANPLVHAVGIAGKIGWAGVTLFFLLSGFLITGILWDSRGEEHWWRNFYVRRILRIFPLYYASLVVVLLAGALGGAFKPALKSIWVPALFLQNFPRFIGLEGRFRLDLFHYWSLAVEEQFYLLWPLLLFAVRNRKQATRICLWVFALSLGFRLLVCMLMPDPQNYASLLLSRAGELALGGWIALMYRGPNWGRLQAATPFLGVLSGAVVLAVAWHRHSFEIDGPLQFTLGLCAITIFLAAVLVRSLQPGIVQRMMSAKWLRWIGKISFGIYIFHILFIRLYTAIALNLVGGESRMALAGARWLVAAVGSVSLAWLSYKYFEEPILRVKKRFSAHTV